MALSENRGRSEQPADDRSPSNGPPSNGPSSNGPPSIGPRSSQPPFNQDADLHHDLLNELLCTLESLQQQSRDIRRVSTELRARLAEMDRELAAQHPHDQYPHTPPSKPL